MPAEDLHAHALEKARKLAAKPAAALAATRALMRGDLAALHARMRQEEAAFSQALASADAQEAFTAFLERRPPRFGGTADGRPPGPRPGLAGRRGRVTPGNGRPGPA